MEILTNEKIAELTDDLYGLANIRAINKLFRQQDESRLYPINGRFDCTERAIRKARAFRREAGAVYGLEYCYLIDGIISQIVNDPNI
jgi:hypothetical protein